jgi:hypothetical protein
MQNRPKPVIYIAFANDLEHPEHNLSGLAVESANINAALRDLCDQDASWELFPNADCTPAKLVEPFYSNRVAIFHYGGHASPSQILLETDTGANKPASAPLLAEFLAKQETLKLVFLNACSTRDWAENLVRLGVPCVVATSRPIQDDIALKFAAHFYESLACDLTISEAFEKAASGIKFSNDLLTRTIDLPDGCEHQSDGFPWAIYPSATGNGSNWKLSVGANDPFIGLPQLDPAEYPLPSSPYVSIEGHQPSDAQIFFGRNGEIRRLYDWVFNHGTEPPILLFYGQSGVGKSSLLRAGLLPRLAKQVSVTYLRRNRDLTEDLHQAIGGASDDAAIAWLKSETPRLIILDQVEEAITHHGGDSSEMMNFIRRLIEIYSICDCTTKQPLMQSSRARLILSFRKEYLAEIRNPLLNGVPDGFPKLVQDFWLERLDCDGIEQVVMGPVYSRLLRDKYKLNIPEPDFAAALANSLDDGNSPIATILQIVLGKLWNTANETATNTGGDPIYTKELYKRVSTENPLKSFYDQQVAQLGSSAGGIEVDQGLELDLLYEHTTNLVTSRRRMFAELRRSYPQVPNLQDLITRNKELHLLTEPAKDEGRDANETAAPEQVTALAHDTLATVVRREFELSLQPGSRARRILENRARDWSDGRDGDMLDKADLKVVEKGLPQMRSLTAEEQRMLGASRERQRKARRAVISGLSAAAVVITALFALTVTYLQEIAHVKTLNSKSADNQLTNNQLLALLQSMQAARDLQHDWRLRALPNRTLSRGVLEKLRLAIQGTAEVGRYPVNRLGLAAGPCAVAFNAQDQLRFRSIGATSGTWNGMKVPDILGLSSLATCDPVSGRFVTPIVGMLPIPMTWKDGSGTVIRPAALNDVSMPAGAGPINRISVSPTGNMLAFLRGGSLILFDLNASRVVQRLPAEPKASAIAFSPDGALVGEGGQSIKIWDVRSGRPLLNQSADAPILGLRFGANAFSRFLATSSDGGGVDLWKLPDVLPSSVEDQFHSVEYSYPHREPAQLAINGSGTMLAIGTTDGSIDVWKIPADLTESAWFGDEPDEKRLLSNVHASIAPIRALGFSPDSKYLATTPSKEDAEGRDFQGNVRVWGLDLTPQKSAAARSNLKQLFQMGCLRLRVYLDVTAGSSAAPVKDVDLKSLQTACKAALAGGTKSGR